MGSDRVSLQRSVAACAVALATNGVAWSCGFDDPNSALVQRGMMNLAFPKSAYVRTAIWQAQLDGVLPRDALTERAELTPQAIGTMRLMRATLLLHTLAKRLGASPSVVDRPSVALVLLGPMLWTRLEPQGSRVQMSVHVASPEAGDVVLVTDTPVIEAIVEGTLTFEQAIERGVVRLYGPQAQIDKLISWLAAT